MRRRFQAAIAILVMAAASVAASIGCGGVATEEKIVKDFFRAARLRDNATLGTFATASFDPRTQGQVQNLTVLNISEERSNPLPIRQYTDAVEQARATQETFSKEKLAYQHQNIRAIERVVAAESKNQPVSRQDAVVQTDWTKWRDDQALHSKAVADAQRRLANVKGLAELSLSQPTGPTPDVTQMDGRMMEKDVTVEASVRTPDGATETRTLVVTLERAVMKDSQGAERAGRWIVTRVREPQAPANTQR